MRKQGYRLVSGVQNDVLTVMVMAVDKREDSAAYQSATARIAEMVAELANGAVQKKNFQEVSA